jgi:hypothetical protein
MRIGLAFVVLVAFSSAAFAEDQLPLARPAKARQSFQDAEKHDLKGFSGISMGDIGGKKLKDIVTDETTNRVIVLANHTSAPNNVHLGRIARLMELNPMIESIGTKDKVSGERKWDISYDNIIPYFAVLLGDKNGHFVGLLFLDHDKTEMLKVVSETGVGVVRIAVAEKNDHAGLKTTTSDDGGQPQISPTTLQAPIHLDELFVWRDGGSLGFKLSDANGRHLAFCVDGKFKSPTAGYFFLNVTYADQNGGQKLDLGSDTEKVLMSYLKSWLAANFKQERLAAILKAQGVGKPTKEEFNALHVLGLIDNRAKVIDRIREQAQQDQSSAHTSSVKQSPVIP